MYIYIECVGLEQAVLEWSGHTNKHGSMWKLVHTLHISALHVANTWVDVALSPDAKFFARTLRLVEK